MPPNRGPIKKGSKPTYVKTRGGKVLNKNPRKVTRATGPAGPRGNTGPTGPKGKTDSTGRKTRPVAGVKAKGEVKIRPRSDREKYGKAYERKVKSTPGLNASRTNRGKGVQPIPVGKAISAAAPPFIRTDSAKELRAAYKDLAKGPSVKGLVKTAGASSSPQVRSQAKAVPIVLKSTAVTTAKQPGRTAKETARSVVGIPAGLIRLALHPEKGAKAIAQDYARRYGPALSGDYKKFHERQMKEGAAPEVFDIAGAASAGGATTGRLLQSAANGGKLGEKAAAVASKERVVRVSGGERGIVRREPSKNFYKNAASAAVEKIRARTQRKRVERKTANAVETEAQAAGQVTYVRRAAQSRAQRKMVARRGGEALAALKAEQSREVTGGKGTVTATIRSLDKNERKGLKYASQYGIRTPEQARTILTRNIARIKQERAKAAAEGRDLTILNDELPVLEDLVKNADKVFTPRLRAAVKTEGNRSRRLAMKDPALATDQMVRRAYQPAGELLGVTSMEGESAVQYARRVRKKMSEEGLGSPSYFKSEQFPKLTYSLFAKGGRRAVEGEKRYTGALTRTGRESGSPEIMVRSALQNIKRRVNWNLVGDTIDEHVFPWTKDKNYTAHELQVELRKRGIDPDSVILWNPRLMRESRKNMGEHAVDADPSHVSANVEAAMHDSSGTFDNIEVNPDKFNKSGWQLLPRDVYHEVVGTVGGGREGKFGRGWDIAKGKVSRVLLANPAWLGFQVGSNSLMYALSRSSPRDLVRGSKFFKSLPDEIRPQVEATFGVHGWYDNQRHLGSMASGRFTRSYQLLKQTPLYRAAHNANPLDRLFFRPDNAQNNVFRRAIMYNRLKREAYKRMGEDVTTITGLQDRLVGMLNAGKHEDVMRELVKNRDVVEKHAQAVDDFLGNWTTYTAKERHFTTRFVMFYGFLRFSTRLAFYTMPVKHPIMSSMMLQIGRLERDEIRTIFGSAGGEPPPWEYGNFYGSDLTFGEKPKPGKKIDRYPLVRLVPFFNAATTSPQLAFGSMAYPLVEGMSLLAGKNIPLQKPYTINGTTAETRKALGLGDAAQIALGDTLRLSPYYRVLERNYLPGKQSSDSSLLFPQPMKYKRKDKIEENAARIREQKKLGLGGTTREMLLPAFGTDGSRQLKQSAQFAQGKKRKKVKKNTSEIPTWTIK